MYIVYENFYKRNGEYHEDKTGIKFISKENAYFYMTELAKVCFILNQIPCITIKEIQEEE